MIPQMQERIAKLEAIVGDLQLDINRIGENLGQLRQQLQIERPPENLKQCEPSPTRTARY
jgi:hypothetical protein